MLTALVVGPAHGTAHRIAHVALQRKHAYSRMDGCLVIAGIRTGPGPRSSGTVAMIGQT
ncbi:MULTISPECIES: hypothetical protein [Cupriavidus]|uniref:hypothetical protein n=1 Tax=Cupriavidus taiwanensis TaxID=164546 RepID=UPI0015741228|nr:hypothetical protein [Cupriavidus taiwanensis]NSX17134.1 hypothetical protein [Cupriavidus taiwanensis]